MEAGAPEPEPEPEQKMGLEKWQLPSSAADRLWLAEALPFVAFVPAPAPGPKQKLLSPCSSFEEREKVPDFRAPRRPGPAQLA